MPTPSDEGGGDDHVAIRGTVEVVTTSWEVSSSSPSRKSWDTATFAWGMRRSLGSERRCEVQEESLPMELCRVVKREVDKSIRI
ncbi:MAG: hypothetical protein MI717_08270 [Spirochaetales bacterium]|nr:hypothetical protein [Spirochaetales bacterium]